MIRTIETITLSPLRTYKNFRILKCKKGHVYAIADYYYAEELVGDIVFYGYKFPIRAVVKFAGKSYVLSFNKGLSEHILASVTSLEAFFKVVMFHVLEIDDYFFTDAAMRAKINICEFEGRECLCEAALFFGKFMGYHESFWNKPTPPCA